MRNKDIRELIKKKRVFHYEVAEALGSQMDYKKEIIEMIEKITKTENISMLYGVVKTMVEYEDQKEKKQGSI